MGVYGTHFWNGIVARKFYEKLASSIVHKRNEVLNGIVARKSYEKLASSIVYICKEVLFDVPYQTNDLTATF